MTEILAHTAAGQVYPMKIKAARLLRRYEDKEYSFLAGDLKLDCVDAGNLYRDVNAGVQVSVAVKEGATTRFRGTVMRDGTGFDPESEVHSFPVIHQSKRIFEAAKAQLELNPSQTKDGTFAFDYVSNSYLRAFLICTVQLNRTDFEFAASGLGSGRDHYWAFLQEHTGYTTRDFWVDFAKHYRALLSVSDDPVPVLRVIPRRALTSVVHVGYDPLIAEYHEEMRDAQFQRVLFPAKVAIYDAAGSQSLTLNCYVTYSPAGVVIDMIGSLPFGITARQFPSATVNLRAVGGAVTVPDETLDLRVPNGMYGEVYPEKLPLDSVPLFKFMASSLTWSGESPLGYCGRHFASVVREFLEVNVLYSLPLPVRPQEQISVRGSNALIVEVEDDLVDETTRIIGRLFA